MIDPNNPTGAVYPRETRRRCSPSRATRPRPAGRRGVRGPRLRRNACAARGPRSRRGGHLLLVALQGVSRAWLARRVAGGRPHPAADRRPRRDQEARRRATLQPGPDAYAITAALTGDRSHQEAFRRRSSSGRISRRDGSTRSRACVRAAARRVLRDAAGVAAARQDRRGLRARPAARDGRALRLRVRVRHRSLPTGSSASCFSRSPRELDAIYDLVESFTRDYLVALACSEPMERTDVRRTAPRVARAGWWAPADGLARGRAGTVL